RFFENGYYKIDQKLLFEPPIYNRKLLFHIYNSNVTLLEKLKNNIILTDREVHDLQNLPSTFMICYFNGFGLAKQNLIDSKYFLKPFKSIYKSFKESLRILRKVKYNK
ncbi:MAG: hypothetical protein RLZZ312_98, partial [Bacteroidota bacterium]